MVAPLLPVLYYLVTSNILSGIFLLVLSFPFSIMYAFEGQQLGLQLPTEPLIVAFLGFWIFHQILNHEEGLKYSKHGRVFIYTYVFYFLALFLSVLVAYNKITAIKLFVATFCYSSILVFVLNHEIKKFETLRTLLITLFSVTIVLVVYTLSRHVANGLTHNYSNFAPWPFYEEHGSYGSYVAIVFGLSFCIAVFNKWRDTLTVLAATTAGITFIGVIFSFARASWLSLIVFFVFLLVIRFKNLLNARVIILGIILITAVSSFYVRIEINEEIQKNIESITDVQRNISNLERINRWVAAYNMFDEHKLFGVGFGNYLIKYQDYRDYRFTTPISDMFAQAHSEYFQHLAETGITGLSAWLLLLITYLLVGVKTYNKITHPLLKSILIGSVGGTLTYMIHGFFNGFLMMDKVAVPFWLSIGITFLIVNKWEYFEDKLRNEESHLVNGSNP